MYLYFHRLLFDVDGWANNQFRGEFGIVSLDNGGFRSYSSRSSFRIVLGTHHSYRVHRFGYLSNVFTILGKRNETKKKKKKKK